MTWDASLGKDIEAAWGSATESKIEKPTPEERKEWAIPQTGNAWGAPPPTNRGNPYRPIRTRKESDGSPDPSAAARDGTLWTIEGDASWGTGTITKKMLDSEQTEGMIRRVLGERAPKDTPRYIYHFVLIATSLMPIAILKPPDKRSTTTTS